MRRMPDRAKKCFEISRPLIEMMVINAILRERFRAVRKQGYVSSNTESDVNGQVLLSSSIGRDIPGNGLDKHIVLLLREPPTYWDLELLKTRVRS